MVLASSIMQVLWLLLVAGFAFDVDLPPEPAKWLPFAWVFLSGVITSCALGIALSALVIPIVLLLQFSSRVYLNFSQLPGCLQNVAGILPLTWMAQGMGSVFLPASFEVAELGEAWDWGSLPSAWDCAAGSARTASTTAAAPPPTPNYQRSVRSGGVFTDAQSPSGHFRQTLGCLRWVPLTNTAAAMAENREPHPLWHFRGRVHKMS